MNNIYMRRLLTHFRHKLCNSCLWNWRQLKMNFQDIVTILSQFVLSFIACTMWAKKCRLIVFNLNDIFSCKTASVLYSWIASLVPLLLNSCEMKQIFNVCLIKKIKKQPLTCANNRPMLVLFRIKISSVIKNDMIGYDQIRVLAFRYHWGY